MEWNCITFKTEKLPLDIAFSGVDEKASKENLFL